MSALSIPLPLLLLSLIFSIGLCIPVVRTHQDSFWLWIILMFQPLGGIVYIAAIIVWPMFSGRTARKLSKASREALDPHRTYREAKDAVELSPSVHNRMKLAAAATELGRHAEAEAIYREAAQGVHAEDPALQLGRAKALLELRRPAEALELLDAIERAGETTGPAILAFGRAYQALGRNEEAERAYRQAMDRTAGMESIARNAAFLRATGRTAEAREMIEEVNRRAASATGPFRKEAQAWQELASRG
jgi:hypothetical protein